MKRKRKRKNRYVAEYEADELKLKLKKGISFRVNLKDDLEVGVLLAKFRQADLGSSRELGELFNRSASTVINKEQCSQFGSKHLIDGREQKKKYKLEELRYEILLIWVKKPLAEDKDIFKELQLSLSSRGMKLNLKTLRRYLKETGIDEVRSRLHREGVMGNREESLDSDAAANSDKTEKEQTTEVFSRYAAQMLGLPQLSQLGFSEMVKVLPSPWIYTYSKERVAYQLYFLYATGLKRLYDLDSLGHSDFGALLGAKDHLRSSGMNKRIGVMAQDTIIEVFQKEALSNRARLINRRDCELAYCDSHVIEVWVNKAITMAKHGTKNKRVKAINVHYLVGSESATPLAKEYTAGNKRLHQAIPRLIERADEGLKEHRRRLKNICFDKGGISLKTLKGIIKAGKGFLCWGRRAPYVKKQIERIKDAQFRYKHKKEIRQGGKIKKLTEKIADTTTYLKKLGKIRTAVVKLPEEEGGDRLWMYTNLKRSEYSAVELREMMRYKQRQEVYFKIRRYKSALDCYAGGSYKVRPILRPSERQLELLEKQHRRLVKRIKKDEENLFEVKELKSHKLLGKEPAKRETDYLKRRIEQAIEQKQKTEEKIQWAEGGKKPGFIKQRYELELNKQKLLNEFQDLVVLSKRETIKEFLACYRNILRKEGYLYEEITQRMKYLDKVAIEKELFNLGGIIIRDEKQKQMSIMIKSQGREYFRKALRVFLEQLNRKRVKVDYGGRQQYRLYFCLAPPT